MERMAIELGEIRQDMRAMNTRITTMETRLVMMWVGTMGTVIGGFIALFLKGG